MKALGFNNVEFELYHEINKKSKYRKDKKDRIKFEILEILSYEWTTLYKNKDNEIYL